MSPPARLAPRLLLVATLLAGVARAHADVGGTLSLQTDARERGMSYSDNRPSAQLGLAWDGAGGWYGGTQLGHARFTQRRGATLQLYAGRVLPVSAGLDAEAGVVAHLHENVSHYDYQEAYVGLLGDGWTARAYLSPDYYGIGERSLYVEFNGRWPLREGLAAIGHAGLLHGWRRSDPLYAQGRSPSRGDLRLGLSWQLGGMAELQLAWLAASRGGPYVWTEATRRRTAVLSLTAAF